MWGNFSQWLIPASSISISHLFHPITRSTSAPLLITRGSSIVVTKLKTSDSSSNIWILRQSKAVIWHTDENLMIPFESLFPLKLKRRCFNISKLEMALGVCNSDTIWAEQNMCSVWFLRIFSSASLCSGWGGERLVIKVKPHGSSDLFQSTNPVLTPLFKIQPEMFQAASLQTSNPRVNFTASKTVQGSRQRMQSRKD